MRLTSCVKQLLSMQDRVIEYYPNLAGGAEQKIKLITSHSKMFSKCFDFSPPIGWLQAVEHAIGIFENLQTRFGGVIKILQIKEKFGGLRLYVEYKRIPKENRQEALAEFSNTITSAEASVRTICSVCGEPGSHMNINGWLQVVCEQHAEEARKRK